MTDRTINTSLTNMGYTDNELTTVGSGSISYDRNGNITAAPKDASTSMLLGYNWDNKLNSAYINGSVTAFQLKYDPAGNRVQKTSSVNGLQVRKYIVDIVGDLPVVLLELQPTTSGTFIIKKTNIYANAEILSEHDGAYNAVQFYYLHDRLGSVRQVLNSSGEVVKIMTFSPYGETLEEEGGFDTQWKFTGQYLDNETGQYYLRARQYSPYLSRFTSPDLIMGKFEEPMSLHRYLYCGNNSVNGIDLMGLWNDGMRYAIREQKGMYNAYTLSDEEIKSNFADIWGRSYENYIDPITKEPTGTIWQGHSDMGYHTGDFDYTTMDHMDWSRPTKPWNIFGKKFEDGPASGYPYHFMPLWVSQSIVLDAIGQGDIEVFQEAMHMGQDYFSHYAKGYRWYTAGHAFAGDGGHAPDKPYDKRGASVRELNAAYKAADQWTKSMENAYYLLNDSDMWWRLHD